ncbi:MAG TPA: hypothetical protein VIC63_03995 [Candidatus Limnocylindria bacterium]|jgi:hypothetical protein
MSRAERRQYQKMKKTQDPYAPRTPAGGGRPPRRKAVSQPRDWSFTRGFWLRAIGIALVVGAIALSVTWTSGAQTALLAAAAGAALTLGLLAGSRYLLLRRAAPG